MATPTHSNPAPRASPPTPLPAAHAFTFINSLGTGVVTGALPYLSKASYNFSDRQNYLLGALVGVTYILAAIGAGRAVKLLQSVGISSRAMLCWMMLLLSALSWLPWVAQRQGSVGTWPIWLLVGTYAPLTGVLWPMVESYMSGGRSGRHLLRATGQWNVVWSSAIPITYGLLALFETKDAALAIALLGMMHVAALAALRWFPREPGAHADGAHEPHPPVYARLLMSFRVLLPTSYLVSCALTPFLPGAMAELGVPARYTTIVAISWLLPRVCAFALLGWWPGWHGRWWPTVLGAALLLLGFAACVLSRTSAHWFAPTSATSPALAIMVGGLACFGLGMGIIYSGAIYYALEVGKAEVDAGGMHEALIGLGYVGGPICGLVAMQMTGSQGRTAYELPMLVIVGVITLLACLGVGVRAHRAGSNSHPTGET